MQLDDVLNVKQPSEWNITSECSTHLAFGIPIYKHIPFLAEDVARVKVRHGCQSSFLAEAFKHAFNSERTPIIERAVRAVTTPPLDKTGWFYVLPINGHSTLVSTIPTNIIEMAHVLASELDITDTIDLTAEVVSTAFSRGPITPTTSEVIVYDTPYYFALRADRSMRDWLSQL